MPRWCESAPSRWNANAAWGLLSFAVPPRGIAAKSSGSPVAMAWRSALYAESLTMPKASCGSVFEKLPMKSWYRVSSPLVGCDGSGRCLWNSAASLRRSNASRTRRRALVGPSSSAERVAGPTPKRAPVATAAKRPTFARNVRRSPEWGFPGVLTPSLGGKDSVSRGVWRKTSEDCIRPRQETCQEQNRGIKHEIWTCREKGVGLARVTS